MEAKDLFNRETLESLVEQRRTPFVLDVVVGTYNLLPGGLRQRPAVLQEQALVIIPAGKGTGTDHCFLPIGKAQELRDTIQSLDPLPESIQ